MLAMVARSGTGRAEAPSPWNSTNFPTTFALRSISVMVSTTSVAVTPAGTRPVRFTPTTSGVRKYTGWPSMAASASMPPTPQARMPRPLVVVVCESVPTSLPGALHGAAHGGEVDHQRHAREVLQEHARDDEGDLLGALGARLPGGEVLHVLLAHPLSVQVAQERLEHDAQADREARHGRVLV